MWQQYYCFDMYLISSQFPYRDVNTTIMELLIMVYACRTSCARNIIGVIPYFPYSKQCKMRKRGSIVSKLLASMMCKAGKAAGFINGLLHYCIPRCVLTDMQCSISNFLHWLFALFFWPGLTHLITMDLHQKEIQGFFNIPVDNLRASPFLLQYIQEEVCRPVDWSCISDYKI